MIPERRHSVVDVAKWELDADLVALSACETALGPDGGGEGLLGFSQVMLGRRNQSRAPALIVEQVGEQADEFQQP